MPTTAPYANILVGNAATGLPGTGTAADGSYSLVESGQTGPFQINIVDPVFAHVLTLGGATPLASGESRTVDIVDSGVGTVQVSVRDGSGNLLPGVTVKISSNTQFVDSSTQISQATALVSFPLLQVGSPSPRMILRLA